MNVSGEHKAADSLLKLSEVERRTALKKSSIYAAINAGRFPAPVRLSVRAVAWRASAIDAWIQARPTTGTV